jgi:hypothetical protein
MLHGHHPPELVQICSVQGHQARQAAPGLQQRCHQRAGSECCRLARAQQLPGCVVLPGLADIKAGDEAIQEPLWEPWCWQLLTAGFCTSSVAY